MSQTEIHPDFKTRQWCMDIINSPMNKEIPWPSRPTEPPADHSCSFVARTLNTTTGIRAAHTFWRPNNNNEQTEADQVLLLVSLGDGMNYYSQMLHGGMVAGLMDEAVGLFIMQKLGVTTAVGSERYTVRIEIDLRGKVETPGVYLVRAWADEARVEDQAIEWKDRKKIWGMAAIEDGDGRVLIKGKYLFIRPRATKL